MTSAPRDLPEEWDAGIYHRVSAPQVRWGSKGLGRLTLEGDETVVDAGCGRGRLTADLLERLPPGHVIAVDQSTNMLAEAAAHLIPRFGDRISFRHADIQNLELSEPVDAIFSTATSEPAPTTFPDAQAFSEFAQSVVLPAHLDALPDAADRRSFMAEITALAAADNPTFRLDYRRLNLSAPRPLPS